MTGTARTRGPVTRRAAPVAAAFTVLAATVGVALLAAGPVAAGLAPKPPLTIEVGSTNAYLWTFQALSSVNEVENQKDDSNFVRFAESLSPETLAGTEGTADAFATQASTVVTPSFDVPFQAEGLAMSGGLQLEAEKEGNGAPGVPVAVADGDFDASFGSEASASPIPIELAGYLRAANDDDDECTEVGVDYDDGSQSFVVAAGGACTPGLDRTRGFQVNQTLPPGAEVDIEVWQSAAVSAEDPGSTESANASVNLTLSFYPPDTRITSANVRAGSGKASFKFKAKGNAKRLQCALTRKGKKLRFRDCRSPKRYRNLKPGRYTFMARAVGSVAPEATPAKETFRIR